MLLCYFAMLSTLFAEFHCVFGCRAANFIWHTGHDLPGLSDESRTTVQKALSVRVQQISKELVMFCYDLDQEMATTGWIKSRATETREQDELLILYQQM